MLATRDRRAVADHAGPLRQFGLDAGGQLSVVRQNTEPVDFPDGRVRLTWRKEHNFRVPEAGTASKG